MASSSLTKFKWSLYKSGISSLTFGVNRYSISPVSGSMPATSKPPSRIKSSIKIIGDYYFHFLNPFIFVLCDNFLIVTFFIPNQKQKIQDF